MWNAFLHSVECVFILILLSGAGYLLGDVNNETIGHANLKNRSERTESLKRK